MNNFLGDSGEIEDEKKEVEEKEVGEQRREEQGGERVADDTEEDDEVNAAWDLALKPLGNLGGGAVVTKRPKGQQPKTANVKNKDGDEAKTTTENTTTANDLVLGGEAQAATANHQSPDVLEKSKDGGAASPSSEVETGRNEEEEEEEEVAQVQQSSKPSQARSVTILPSANKDKTANNKKRGHCGHHSEGTAASQPLVAVIASTTSRGVVKKGKTKALSPSELAARLQWVDDTTKGLDILELVLFTTMLPSLVRTLECGFRYVVMIGFDQGDLLFDSPHTKAKVSAWLEKHFVADAASRGIDASFRLLAVANDLKKPGPVFNAMARAVVDTDGLDQGRDQVAEYIYRVNDDTEFATLLWTSKFVAALGAMGPPANVGVVGPSCPQGNRAILTHDFTHRSHMEIFGGLGTVGGAGVGEEDAATAGSSSSISSSSSSSAFGGYYPPVLTDWFMDDWISRVYGSKRTKLLKDVEVVHHSKTYGRRYDVDGKHRHLVDELVESGKERVLKFLKKRGASAEALKRFSSDRFNHRQQQREVDQSTISRKSSAVRPPGHR